MLMYERIQDLPKARVEKIGEYYTVRIGFWKSRQTAEAFRGVTRRIAQPRKEDEKMEGARLKRPKKRI